MSLNKILLQRPGGIVQLVQCLPSAVEVEAIQGHCQLHGFLEDSLAYVRFWLKTILFLYFFKISKYSPRILKPRHISFASHFKCVPQESPALVAIPGSSALSLLLPLLNLCLICCFIVKTGTYFVENTSITDFQFRKKEKKKPCPVFFLSRYLEILLAFNNPFEVVDLSHLKLLTNSQFI